jgi:hypothetical protein
MTDTRRLSRRDEGHSITALRYFRYSHRQQGKSDEGRTRDGVSLAGKIKGDLR